MWTYVLAAILGLIPLLLWSKQRPAKLPPGPLNWPVVNNLLNLSFNAHFRQSLGLLHDKYGPIISLSLGFGLWTVFVRSPELVKEVLYDSRFSGRSMFSFFSMLNFDNGISFGQGEKWKQRKKVLLQVMKSFGFGKSVFAVGVEQEVKRLMDYLDKTEGQVIDIQVRSFRDCPVCLSFKILTEELQENIAGSRKKLQRLLPRFLPRF